MKRFLILSVVFLAACGAKTKQNDDLSVDDAKKPAKTLKYENENTEVLAFVTANGGYKVISPAHMDKDLYVAWVTTDDVPKLAKRSEDGWEILSLAGVTETVRTTFFVLRNEGGPLYLYWVQTGSENLEIQSTKIYEE